MNAIRTQCPTCLTIFDLSADILTQAKGLVRCGSCQHIFKAEVFVEPTKKEIEKEVASGAHQQAEPLAVEAARDTNGSALGLPLYQLGDVSIYKPANKPSALQKQSSIDAFGNLKVPPKPQATQAQPSTRQALASKVASPKATSPQESPSKVQVPQVSASSKPTESAQSKSNLPLQKKVDAPNQSERKAFGLATDLTNVPVQANASVTPTALLDAPAENLAGSEKGKSKTLPKKPRISLLNLFLTFILLILLLVFVLSLAMQFIPEFKALVLSALPMLPVYWKQIQALIDFSVLKNLFNL
jgi:predicted Zn finger-like uncharacterized protein